MKTGALHNGILVSLFVGGLAGSAWGQQAPKPAPDEDNRLPGPISCVVKITCDPALLPLTPESVLALVQSSYVAGEALKRAFEISYPDPGQYQYQIEFEPLAGGMTAAPPGRVPMMGMMGGIGPQPPQAGRVFAQGFRGGGMSAGGFGGGAPGGPGVRPPGPPDGVGDDGPAGPPGGPESREMRPPGAPDRRPPAGAAPGREGDRPIPPDRPKADPGDRPPGVPEREPFAGPGPRPNPGFRQPYPSVPLGVPGWADGRRPASPGEPMMPGGAVPPRFPGMAGSVGRQPMFDIMVPAPRESSIVGRIQVSIENAPPSRHEAFLKAICERLQQSLASLHDQELDSVKRQMEMSRDEQARAEKRLRDLQKQRQHHLVAGQGDLMPEAVMDQIRRLDFERQRMEMDLLGQQARLKALQQQIQATGERILKEPGDDAMIKPLQAKLDQLREHLKSTQVKSDSGMIPQSEVQKIQIAIFEAESQLAEARRRVSQAGGGEVLGRLNTELAMLSVNAAETEARLKYIREQMETNKQLAGAADEYEMGISMEMPYARRAYEMSKIRVEELEQRIRTAVAPTVTVIGGATSKPAK